jgi:translation initiation factor 3 subunit C
MEYLYRLRDECQLTKQCDAIMEYLSKHNDQEKQARVGLIKLERIYYKHDSLYEKTKAALKGQTDKLNEIYFLAEPSKDVVEKLVDLVSRYSQTKLVSKAIMLQVYHHAIHNRYQEAKDLMLKSHIGQTIAKQQISNQILYNRAVV